jgi:hypothetical protein
MSTQGSVRALQLLAELNDLDRSLEQQLGFAEKQRRRIIARELHEFAMTLQGRMSSGGASRREHPRASIELPVVLLGGPHPVELIAESIAVGGVAVRTRNFIPRNGDLWPLRFPIEEAGKDHSFEVLGRVVWVDVGKGRAGIRFTEVSDGARTVLERIVFSALLQQPGQQTSTRGIPRP